MSELGIVYLERLSLFSFQVQAPPSASASPGRRRQALSQKTRVNLPKC